MYRCLPRYVQWCSLLTFSVRYPPSLFWQGWLTTLPQIREHYGSLEAWLKLHQVDVLCIQEVKV